MSLRDDAKNHCEFMQPDCTCTLMMAMQSEDDPRCKLFRDEPTDCRYLRLYVMNGHGDRATFRGGRAREKRAVSN